MTLLDILNDEYFEDKEILKTLNKHSKEIEDEKTRYKTMQNMGKGRISDIDKIPFLYNSGSAADAALADDILDLEHRRLMAKKAQEKQKKNRTQAVNRSKGKSRMAGSADHVDKLSRQYIKKNK